MAAGGGAVGIPLFAGYPYNYDFDLQLGIDGFSILYIY